VASFLILRGRCRKCKAKISSRYLIVEVLTGFLFALFYYVYFVAGAGKPLGVFLIHLILVSALVSASFIDLDRQIIPDRITIGGLLVAPVVSLLYPELHEPIFFDNPNFGSLAACFAGMIVGGSFIFIAGAVGKLVFKKEAMGFGDVKLMGMVGAFLGWQGVLLANLLAPFFGCMVGIPLILKTGERFKRIPYGPFLSLATVCAMLFGQSVINWYVNRFIG
jgi:leader peptidase (prepilin peptidase)/N-methyltransferase